MLRGESIFAHTVKSKIILLLTSIALASCKRDQPTTWSVDVAMPVAHGRITLSDLVPDSLLSADENGLWHLLLEENLTDFNLDSLVAIPDTLIQKIFEVPPIGNNISLPPGQQLISQNENTTLAVNDVELKEVIAKSGWLEYNFKSYVNGHLQCIYYLPGVTLNGVPTTIDVHTLPGNQFVPYEESGVIDLTGYHIDLTGETGTQSNKIYSELEVKVDPDVPQPAIVSSGDEVIIEIHFVDPKVAYARGYFGQHEYELNEVVDFAGDISFPEGALNLDQVSLDFAVQNYVGSDAQIDFGLIRSVNNSTGDYVLLNNIELLQSINVTRASDNSISHADASSVEPTFNEIEIDNSNSNIDFFLENLPDELVITGDVIVNPLGDVTDGNDFIYTAQALSAVMRLDIPLCVGLEEMTLRDTLEITSDVELTADGKLFITVTNGFPFSARLDASVIDLAGNQTHVLIDEQTIAAAVETAVAGEVIEQTTPIEVEVSQDMLDDFDTQHRIALKVVLNTNSFEEFAKLYEHYFMDFSVRAEAETKVSID